MLPLKFILTNPGGEGTQEMKISLRIAVEVASMEVPESQDFKRHISSIIAMIFHSHKNSSLKYPVCRYDLSLEYQAIPRWSDLIGDIGKPTACLD